MALGWWKWRLLFAAATFGFATASFGGAGVITTVVEPLSTVVTYSRNASTSPPRPALTTFVGYRVSIGNAGRNTINHILFTGTTAVTDRDEITTFVSADGASCVATDTALTSIECSIGQLKAGESFPAFFVFFEAPAKDTVSPLPDGNTADCVHTDCVGFSGKTLYAERTGGVPKSKPQNSIVDWESAAVALGTSSLTFFKSALPKSGGNFFTGDGADTSSTDPFAVAVNAPRSPVSSTVELSESDVSSNLNCRSLHNFFTCFAATVTMPAVDFSSTSGDFLTFVLRVDAADIKRGTKIGDVLIQYDDGQHVSNVGLCASPTTPRDDGIPCIAKAVVQKSKSVWGWTPELGGDFEWTLLNLKNGRFSVF
jgi:hypothetical protein